MKRLLYKSCLLSTAILLSACASYQPYQRPTELDHDVANAQLSKWSTVAPTRWWQSFQDPVLDTLVAQALADNLSLEAAWQRLQAARALSRRTNSNQMPSVDGSLSAERARGSGNDDVGRSAVFSVAYEVDMWGRARAERMAERYRAQAEAHTYMAAKISLSAAVVNVWTQLVENQSQDDLVQNQLATSTQVLEVLNIRFELGQAQSEDVLRQQLAIAAVRAELITLQTQQKLLLNQLAVLLGQRPDQLTMKMNNQSHLPTLSRLPEAGLPLHLIQNRPDVQQAYLELQAVDRDLAAAVKDQYPQLSLSASSRTEAMRTRDLFSDWVTNLVAGLTAPLFDGGQRRANVARQTALRDQQLANYRHITLQAIEAVSNAHWQESQQRLQLLNLRQRLALAEDAYERIEVRYLNGGTAFLTLLDAQEQQQNLQRQVLNAEQQLIANRITLMQALAGSWQTETIR